MKKKSMWNIKLSTSALVLIPAAVGINYIGKLFASTLKLPLWLDSIGTILASILAGPIVGALCGGINNVIYGLTADPISFIYGLTSIGIGLTVGIMAYKGWINNIVKAVIVGLVAACVAAVISTPINIHFWGGTTGNIWGDGLYTYLVANHFPMWIASFIDEIIVDIPDKIATVVIAYLIVKGLPKKLIIQFSNNDELEKL